MISSPRNWSEQLQNFCDYVAEQLKKRLTKEDADASFLGKEATATSASKLAVNNVGSETKPVYFKGGIPVEVTSIEVGKVAEAIKADTATIATSAQQDGAGNNIASTYRTKADSYSKSEVDAKVSGIYKYKGSVSAESALPTSDRTVGDVYNIETTGMNVAWTGTAWDALGSAVSVDLSAYMTIEDAQKTYVTPSYVSSRYLAKEGTAVKATSADTATSATTAETADVANRLNQQRNIAIAGDVTGTVAFDGSKDVSMTASLANSGVTAGTFGLTADVVGTYNGKFKVPYFKVDSKGRIIEASHYEVTLPAEQVLPEIPDVSVYIPKEGSRGLIKGYETTGNATTITATAPDSNEVTSAVTVENGQAGTTWIKIIRFANAGTVTLGSQWYWAGGEIPEITINGILTCCWCGSGGIATFTATEV